MTNNNDTICALSTATGGAIAVIRISGPEAITITDRLFSKKLADKNGYSLIYGEIANNDGKPIDDVVISLYRAPHSYTGEDSIEISCHGSQYIINQILNVLIEAGCRQALPGEYTQRAFLNGKMDLSQAEAVADLIASTNAASHKIALGQLRGSFSSKLSDLRTQLLKITSLLELELDFSDQDVNFADRDELLSLAEKIKSHIGKLAHSFKTGKAIKSGVPVAIIGKTNVGKSSLLNRLVGEDRAIVSDVHGTTRDVIEDTTIIHGITFRFIDTAGIRKTTDEVEQMGIERTYQKIDEAAIVLWIIDSKPDEKEIAEIRHKTDGKNLIVLQNKIDLHPDDMLADHNITTLKISAKQGINISELEEAIYVAADIPEIKENDVIVTNARHYDALVKASKSIERVISGLQAGLSGDLLSEDLRECINQLGEIVGGTINSDETLQNIFSHFCVGK